VSRSARAGLAFPVGRVHRRLRKETDKRIRKEAPVYAAAVMKYLTAEMLELAGNAAHDNKKTIIKPRHIQLAIRNDEELNKLLKDVIIPDGGVLPKNINGEPSKSAGPKPNTNSPKKSKKTADVQVPWSIPMGCREEYVRRALAVDESDKSESESDDDDDQDEDDSGSEKDDSDGESDDTPRTSQAY